MRPAILVACLVMVASSATAAAEVHSGHSVVAPVVTLVGDSQLDPAALYFVSFDGLVNNESFQQDAIVSFAGYQYTAWYTADRSAVVARRRLPAGAWERATLPHRLTVNDSHNVISLGISPTDGRLHVAMDTHNSTVFYTRSEAGLVSSPASRVWAPARFGAIQRTLLGVELGAITYPQFVVTPERRLQLSYRTGGSGNGTNELAEYDGSTWRKLGRWSSATGSYTAPNGVTSTTRNMYLHGLTYGPGGRLTAAFTWREGNTGVLCNPGGLTNHDTGYVYSDDRGRTWRNNAGQLVGTTGGSAVAVSPSLVVDPLDPNHGLMNQESQAVDATGAPHVVISYVPGRFTQCVTSYAADRTRWGRTFHVFRGANGSWTKREVPIAPNSTGRTRIVFDRSDNIYLVMPFGRIVTASKASGWTDWTLVFDRPSLNVFGEVNVDYSRVASEGVLSVLYQQRSSGTTPSPIRVADFRLADGPLWTTA
jgi:hypothetical protein